MFRSTDDDSALISALRNDSLEAFETLYNRYRKLIFSFSMKYLFDTEESKELVQTVFINLWEHRKYLDENRPVRNYIYRSAVNAIFNVLRKKAVRRKYMLNQLQKPEETSNPYDQIFFSDLDEKIKDVIGSLSPQQRKIYELKNQEGMTCEEIALKLELSVRTVENQVYRVNKLLKKQFRSEFPS
ncbi:MAG TPA: RNA polymerase sigma-70 factor [Bacteroidales bacterium]|nr:RNA polymerase sigma-70 factor [Bacteroidales bacterium]